MRTINYVIVLSLTLILTACQSRPDYVVDEDTMIDLLTDVHMAEGLLDLQRKEVLDDSEYGQEVVAAVLDKYNISKADYDTSLVWYSQHLAKLIRIYRHVDKNLEERQCEWESVLSESGVTGIGSTGDSVSLWRLQPYVVMDEARLSHRRHWELKVDTTFHQGDTVKWKLHVGKVPAGQGVVASMLLVYDETGSPLITTAQSEISGMMSNDTLLSLTCVGSPDKTIAKLSLSLNLLRNDSTSAPLLPCVVDGFELIRLHSKK